MGTAYSLTEGSPAGGTYSGPGVAAGSFFPSTTGTGTFELFYNYTDVNGCSNIDSNTILVYNNSTVAANASSLNLCEGEQLTLSGSGANSYLWDNGVLDGTPFTPTIGTVNYGVIGTDSNGCSDSADITVTINPLPTVNAGVDQTECEGTAITLSASGANSYIWDNAVINNTSFNPPLGATVYSVVGTDVNGCENSDDVQVIMNPNPILIVSSNELFCLGDSITLSASGAITYSWDGGTFSGSDYPVLPLNSVSR
jgi:hypothetical protein